MVYGAKTWSSGAKAWSRVVTLAKVRCLNVGIWRWGKARAHGVHNAGNAVNAGCGGGRDMISACLYGTLIICFPGELAGRRQPARRKRVTIVS